MASLKAEKTVGTQLFGQIKKDPAKTSEAAPKAPAASNKAPKRVASKPQATKKKASAGKSTSKQK